MKRATKSLVVLNNLTISPKILSSTKSLNPINPFPLIRSLSSSNTKATIKTEKLQPSSSKSHRDSLILEKFRRRQLKGSLNSNSKSKTKQQRDEVGFENEKNKSKATKFVSSFQELGLKTGIIGGLSEMGIWVPSEIQCVAIPALLDGKSVVLSSEPGSGRTLAFFLPLIQLLRQDEALLSVKPKHPRALVLCPSEELCDQGFQTARFISRHAKLNSALQCGHSKPKISENLASDSIGMLVATPSETIRYIEEGSVVPDDIKYLVLDEMDTMFDHGFGSEIHKILSQLKNRQSKDKDFGLQTVLVISTITKMLAKQLSPLMERLEQNNAGKVAAMLLKMDEQEVFDLAESLDALKKKVAESMNTFHSS